MTDIDRTTIVARNWDVSHELPDEAKLALFDVDGSELVVLNQLGGAVWKKLDGVRTIEAVAAELIAESEAAPQPLEAEAQIIHFVQELLRRQAVTIVVP